MSIDPDTYLHDTTPIATLDTFNGAPLAVFESASGTLHLDRGRDIVVAPQHADDIVAFARAIVAHADKPKPLAAPFEGQVVLDGTSVEEFVAWTQALPVGAAVEDRDGDRYEKWRDDASGQIDSTAVSWLHGYLPVTLTCLPPEAPAVTHQYPEGVYRTGDSFVYIRHEDVTESYAIVYLNTPDLAPGATHVNLGMTPTVVGAYTLVAAAS